VVTRAVAGMGSATRDRLAFERHPKKGFAEWLDGNAWSLLANRARESVQVAIGGAYQIAATDIRA
jgi:hypothetical protein